MSFVDKFKDAIATRAAEVLSASFTVLLAWAAYQVAPAILPLIESVISKHVLLALFVTSFTLNIVILIIVLLIVKTEPFRLKYGIYWDKDKNPHCPSCKIQVATYDDYHTSGKGYYCKPCNKVFPLADATGKRIDPAQALKEL